MAMKLKRILKWSARVILLALIVAFLVGFIAYWRSTNDCDRKTALVNPMKAIRFWEYACARERALLVKPANLTFEQAGSVAWAGFTALQGLRQGNIQPGQKVLINGATGGVGTFAVQIAKSLGADVTAVCSTGKVDLVRSIGADHVIDYTKEDFTKGEQRYDVIFDNVGNHSFSDRLLV